MKYLVINASPKRRLSASQYFIDLLKIQMLGCETKEVKLTGEKVYDEIFSYFNKINALVIALPVYVDGVPSHVLDFMVEAEKFFKDNNCRFKLYVISNCGFFEGKQCKNVLAIMRSFCNAAGLEWGAGLGIGSAEMLSILRLNPIFEITKFLFSLLIFAINKNIHAGVTSYNWIAVLISIVVFYIVWSFGLFSSLFKMQKYIRKGKSAPDFYTRVTLCPRFLHTLFGGGYWIIRAAFHGTGLWQLYKK